MQIRKDLQYYIWSDLVKQLSSKEWHFMIFSLFAYTENHNTRHYY
jgi:hypothetical protein